MIENREHIGGGLTLREDQARRRELIDAIAAEVREQIRRERGEHGDTPEERACLAARVQVDELETKLADLEHERTSLLAGHGDLSDADRLARLDEIRSHLRDLADQLPRAANVLVIAEGRLKTLRATEEAAHSQGIQQAARKAERDLNEKRKRLSLEYHELSRRMAEIDRELNDPTEQMKVMAQLRAAGLA